MLFVHDFLTDQTILGEQTGSDPLVSIILPTYRRRQSLERTLSSVLAQRFDDFEFLVMDDGSTDGSFDLIERFRARDARVIHLRHERNSGLPALRVNEGIELARGKYLAFQFDDDVWRPKALQSLVEQAERQHEPAMVIGRALFHGKTNEWLLPPGALDLVSLYEQNRLANNSVLFPRQLVFEYGMYDCHIGMRRLCDWDLWLRFLRNIPAVLVDEIVADVAESEPGSIGVTVPWDLALFRLFNSIPRNHLLTPDRWRDYPVGSLRVGGVELEKDLRRRLYEEHIAPYYYKFRQHFPQLEGFMPTLSESKQWLYVKNTYDVSNEVTLTHYNSINPELAFDRPHFQLLPQVSPNWTKENDGLLLVRTVEDQAIPLMNQALQASLPVGLYLDDDLLTFHEYGPEFDCLAPGTPYHRNLTEILKQVDTVWTTTPSIQASVQPFNPRTILHNNAIPSDALPAQIRPRDPSHPWLIGYVGGGYRLEEFQQIWDALVRISREFGERLNFEFWGLDLGSLPPLASPTSQRPFTFSYPYYLSQLSKRGFDILLSPLLGHPTPRLGKSLIKYYECAVAGALGIFSEVPPYASLPAGLTCLKAANRVEDWYRALCDAITMPPREFDLMRARALEHVREEYTERAQMHLHQAAWRATEFHGKTRGARHADGRPRVVYVLHSAHFGGGEIQLWRRFRLARRYGIEPVVVLPDVLKETENARLLAESLAAERIDVEFVEYTCFDSPRSPAEFSSEPERQAIRELLMRFTPALVHSVTFIPSFGQICQEMGVPHIASLYAVGDAFEWLNGKPESAHCTIAQSDTWRYTKRWSDLLNTEKFCAREIVPEAVFKFGQTRYLRSIGKIPDTAGHRIRTIVTGTLQPRKSQLETIEAIGRLCKEGWDCQLDIFGYTHFFPEYLSKCQERIRIHGIEDRVLFRGFSDDVLGNLGGADIMLSLSTFESFPSAIKEAMSAGVLTVATQVGGIPELIIDGVTGILCADISVDAMTDGIRRAFKLTPTQRQQIIEQARRVARSEFHPYRGANDLFSMYNRAIDLEQRTLKQNVPPILPPAAVHAAQHSGIVEQPHGKPQSHILLKRAVRYTITPTRANWMGIDILVGTHNRRAVGELGLRICSMAGEVIREVTTNLAEARDNDWLAFRFVPLVNAQDKSFTVEFRLGDVIQTTRLSLYESNPPEARMRRVARRAGFRFGGNTLYCRMWYAG